MKKVVLFLSLIFCMESAFSFPFLSHPSYEQENTQVSVTIDEKSIENETMKDYVRSLTSKRNAETEDLKLDLRKSKAGLFEHIIRIFVGWGN